MVDQVRQLRGNGLPECQLEPQALGKRPGADAGRVERLELAQHAEHVGHRGPGRFGDFEGVEPGEVAVGVDQVDQQFRRRPVARREIDMRLFRQVGAEIRSIGLDLVRERLAPALRTGPEDAGVRPGVERCRLRILVLRRSAVDERIRRELLVDVAVEVGGRMLQETDGLEQLGGHREPLTDADPETGAGSHGAPYMRNRSPR